MQRHSPLHTAPSWWNQKASFGVHRPRCSLWSALAVARARQREPALLANRALWVVGGTGCGRDPRSSAPRGCGDPTTGPVVPSARAHPRPHQGAPEAAGFPVPAPRWPPSPVAGCAGRGLGRARREAAPRARAGVSVAGTRAGEGGGSRPGSGDGGLDAACPVPLLSLARTPAAPFLPRCYSPGSREPVFWPRFARSGFVAPRVF